MCFGLTKALTGLIKGMWGQLGKVLEHIREISYKETCITVKTNQSELNIARSSYWI